MQKPSEFSHVYNPPFYIKKVPNFQKSVYEKKGHWSEKQQIKYAIFLQIFKPFFQDYQNSILNRIFRIMADFIKTRNHNQCRSHHQKMEKERFQINSIIKSIKSKYPPYQFESYLRKYSTHIKVLNVDVVLNQKGLTPQRNLQKRKKKNKQNLEDEPENQMHEVKIKNFHKQQNLNEELGNPNDMKQTLQIKTQNPNAEGQKKENENPTLKAEYKNDIEFLQEIPSNKDIEVKNHSIKKDQLKTGLQYDDDQSEINPKEKNYQVQFPPQLKNFEDNFIFKFKEKQGFTSSHSSKLIETIQFQQQNYINPQMRPLEQMYEIQIKVLEGQRKWHMKQANQLLLQMNGHLQQVRVCEEAKQRIEKELSFIKNGYYTYPTFSPQN